MLCRFLHTTETYMDVTLRMELHAEGRPPLRLLQYLTLS